jgi:hypothetical protein
MVRGLTGCLIVLFYAYGPTGIGTKEGMAVMFTKKDLGSAAYWEDFGRGAVGGSQVPTPREAADTVLALMSEREALKVTIEDLKKQGRMLVQDLDLMLLKVSNQANELRDKARGFRD